MSVSWQVLDLVVFSVISGLVAVFCRSQVLNTRCKLSSIGQCCYSLGYVLPSWVPVCCLLVWRSSISALDWSERSQGVPIVP